MLARGLRALAGHGWLHGGAAVRSHRPLGAAASSVRALYSTFTPSHRGGSGPPLLCLHGFTDTWRTWELVLPALERHHDVLALTLAGHAGGPPIEGEISDAVLADAVEAAMATRASRPRTSSATRSAATSRFSSPRAAGADGRGARAGRRLGARR